MGTHFKHLIRLSKTLTTAPRRGASGARPHQCHVPMLLRLTTTAPALRLASRCTLALCTNDEPMRVHDAAALCAGTSIGGGFLALPSVSAPMGFLPAAVAMVSMWLLLLVAAFAYAEGATRVLADRESSTNEKEPSRVSIASLSSAAFGARMSSFCTCAFIAQVVAMVTAQLVKTAEIAHAVSGGAIGYVVGCTVPAVLFGALTLRAAPRVIERINTALTVAILGGFGLLCRNVLAGGGHSAARLVAPAQWDLLLPAVGGGTWALPVFLSVLQFGAAIPVLVQVRNLSAPPSSAGRR